MNRGFPHQLLLGGISLLLLVTPGKHVQAVNVRTFCLPVSLLLRPSRQIQPCHLLAPRTAKRHLNLEMQECPEWCVYGPLNLGISRAPYQSLAGRAEEGLLGSNGSVGYLGYRELVGFLACQGSSTSQI